jgi:alpha-1,3/alpha-1,6-mannosyltransferase
LENVEHLRELRELAGKLGLRTFVFNNNLPPKNTNVLFLPSFSDDQRTFLLSHSLCLLYTPSEEHFGIVPLEAMYSRLPVIAVNSGGPKETVLDGSTGYLCEPTPESFAKSVSKLLDHDNINLIKENGREHVRQNFGSQVFVDRLENVVFSTKDQINLDAAMTYYSFLFFLLCSVLVFISFCS